MLRTRRRLAAVAAAACVGALAGCGGDDPKPPATPAAATPPPLSSFDLFVQASAENNVLFADVYGITLEPLRAHRITVNKRISTMDASSEHIVVAAAEGGNADRLAYVGADGALQPVPGLGRPFAYTPTMRPDGTFVFEEYVDTGRNRYVAYDPDTQRHHVVFTPKRELFGLTDGPAGQLAAGRDPERRPSTLAIRTQSGTLRDFDLGPGQGNFTWGARWIAAEIPGEGFGEVTGFVFFDPETGERKRVDGWQPVTWNPDGTTLLARDAGNPTDSALALIDPATPDEPEPLGTIGGLSIYLGAWPDRELPATP